jgi:hypothetical protein
MHGVWFLLLIACGSQRAAAPPDPEPAVVPPAPTLPRDPPPAPIGAPLVCRLNATAGEDAISLRFGVENTGERAIEVVYYEPLSDFELDAIGESGPLPIAQPPWDHPVQEVRRTIEPHATLELVTPIALRFDPAEMRTDDPMTWTIRSAPVPMTLRAILRFEDRRVGPCEARVVPSR